MPPDPNRQLVDKAQFKALHATGRQEDAHGFALVAKEELEASQGAAAYYSWLPVPHVRFIVIDTLSEGGQVAASSDGNIDDPPVEVARKELDAATARNELIVVIGHHATGSLTASVPDEDASECTERDEHGHDTNPGCDRDPRSSEPLHLGEETKELFLVHPNVVAFVAGHSHNNRVQPFKADGGSGFWEIKSPAISDWPPQQRLIELMENCDGTLSVFGTMLDHDAPVDAPAAGTGSGGFSPAELASIGRVLTYNDPQGKNEDSAGLGPTATSSSCSTTRARHDRRTRSCVQPSSRAASGSGAARADSRSASRPARVRLCGVRRCA